jgi:APA family basic amino acid/polyamine antiporter
MSHSSAEPASTPRPQLSLFDCVCVIVGIIIGSGIYKTSPLITSQTTGVSQSLLDSGVLPAWLDDASLLPLVVLIATWILGALIALCGALCYAELASAYPHHGGDYVYLKRSFGPGVGFFFVWCEFWIVRPANIGAVGFVFSEYFLRLLGLKVTPWWTTGVTAGAVILLTMMNVLGVRSGIRTQNILSVIKVVGLILIFLVAFFVPVRSGFESIPFDSNSAGGSFALAVVLIMFTLGGWNDLAFVSGEVKNPKRNMFWALVLGLACVTGVYILVTFALVHGLGFGGVVQAQEVASDLLQSRLGDIGSGLISGLICISTLGAINGMLYAGARIYYALGKEHPSFGYVGVWNSRRGGPVRGLWAQTLIALGLVVGFGLYENGFTRLVNFSTLFFWTFFFLVGVSLFVLRFKEPDHPRPYRVWGYPVVPILFCLSSLYVFYSSTNYAIAVGGWEWAWAAFIVYAGLLVAAFSPPSVGGEDRTASLESRWTKIRTAGAQLALVVGRAGLVVSGLGTLLGWAAPWFWAGELASHFVLQWLMLSGLSALLLILVRRPWASLLAAAMVVVHAIAFVQNPGAAPESGAKSDAVTVSVASLNLLAGNHKHDEVLDLIGNLDADLVVCLEVTPPWAETLQKLNRLYRFQEITPRDHAFGIAVLSRQPIAAREFQPLGLDRPQLLIRVPLPDDRAWYLGATHVDPPIRPQMALDRDACLNEWSTELLAQGAPAVMMGDFNTTPWSPVFRKLLAQKKWWDSRGGFGNQPTWPSWLGGLGIPIDHALVGSGVRVLNRSTFAIPGSDHRGLLLELSIANNAETL